MRLFAALVPSAAAVRDLDSVLTPVRSLVPHMDWTPPGNWHLTFAYFGNVSSTDAERLQVALREVARRAQPYDVRVKGVGTYPDPRRTVALWAGVEAAGSKLEDTCAAVLDAVRGSGWSLDRRAFRPQLLLGRSREPVDARECLKRMEGYNGPSWAFDALVALQARPIQDGLVAVQTFDTYPLSDDRDAHS